MGLYGARPRLVHTFSPGQIRPLVPSADPAAAPRRDYRPCSRAAGCLLRPAGAGYLLPLAGCGLATPQLVRVIPAAPLVPAAMPAVVRCRAAMTITAA